MSNEETPKVETGSAAAELTAQVEALEKEFQKVLRATARGKRVRLVILLLVLLFICVVFWAFWGLANRVRSQENLNEIMALAQERMGGTGGTLQREATRLVENVQPVLLEALQKQIEKDMPRYQEEFTKQQKILLENLRAELQKKFTHPDQQLLDQYMEILVEEFPEAKDEQLQQRVVGNLTRAMEDMVAKYYVDEFEAQLNEMYETWEEFPVADPPAEGDLPLAQQMLYLLGDLFKPRIMTYELAKDVEQ
ncbi:MAG: hypothetical protein GXP27_12715 [Planctomycetes bacterium]|nr:hypothetical protein [Planctomycetota bacterium]